ncbi:MAG: Holliday junction resolvase RuvX [Deltaproteobacteria bacterium]|nr:Holliday junction resolvase RuvX [Deltaproteobacteria bacterium]MBF0524685.1 Holliday junction resolvase RuvX [Deltaproteobacteria bacterium]
MAGRILALDVGTKTIGVAVSDELGIIAQGLTTIRRRDEQTDLDQVAAIVDEYQVKEVVVGLPFNMDGSIGPSARLVLALVEQLISRLTVPVETWDERWTTMAAERTLIEADVRREKRRKVIDKVAATFILQGYLDAAANRNRDKER